MKAKLLILFFSLLLAGCQPEVPKPTVNPTSTTGAVEHFDSNQRTYHLKDLQRVVLKANGHDIKAWVMDDEGKRQEGMMFLTAEDVADDDGMIFAFATPDKQNFWMKNTLLALDIIYISDKKKILNVQEGKPLDEKTQLPSSGPAQYVLEMKQGAAKRLGLLPGTSITIPDTVKGN